MLFAELCFNSLPLFTTFWGDTSKKKKKYISIDAALSLSHLVAFNLIYLILMSWATLFGSEDKTQLDFFSNINLSFSGTSKALKKRKRKN